MTARRFELALELADNAEDLVRQAGKAVEGSRDPTQQDIAETQLGEALELQDQVLADVAPVIAERERQVMAEVHAAIASLRGDPWADWMNRHRRWHSPAAKSRLVRLMGRKRYEAWFPW